MRVLAPGNRRSEVGRKQSSLQQVPSYPGMYMRRRLVVSCSQLIRLAGERFGQLGLYSSPSASELDG